MKKGKIHAIATCTECGQEWQDYNTALARAARHARETGHRVTGEVAYAMEWGG